MNFYVIDPYPLMAQGLARVLRNLKPYARVIPLERVSQLHAAVVMHGEPCLIVLDLLVPGVKADLTVKELRASYPKASIIVFSELMTSELEKICETSGADGFLHKNIKIAALHKQIRQTLVRRFPIEANQFRLKPLRMTGRQIQLLHTIEYGMSNIDIAEALSLSPHTVKVHLWRLFQRFEVRNRLQLVRYAHDNGLF